MPHSVANVSSCSSRSLLSLQVNVRVCAESAYTLLQSSAGILVYSELSNLAWVGHRGIPAGREGLPSDGTTALTSGRRLHNILEATVY